MLYLRVVRQKKIGLHDKEGKGNVWVSIASLKVYSAISGWVKLQFLKQLLPFACLSLARENESQRKQLLGSCRSRLLNPH